MSLTVGGLRWAQVVAGDAALGPVIKRAKEQLRALPDGLTYGLLRYLQHRRRPDRPGPADRIQLPRTTRAAAADISDELWRISQDGLSVADAATAVPMPLAHTVELNAATVDTDTGPQLHANWTWAPSALDHAQISRLSQLWFDALAGICAHVQHGGGGLTPSDIAPARLTQQQIDELQQHHRIADILPLTPLQQGLLFHASTARHLRRSVCDAARHHRHRPTRPPPAARCGAHRGQPPPQPGGPTSANNSTSRCRSSRPIPIAPWQYRAGLARRRRGTGPAGVRRRTRRGLRPGPPAGVSGGSDPHRTSIGTGLC